MDLDDVTAREVGVAGVGDNPSLGSEDVMSGDLAEGSGEWLVALPPILLPESPDPPSSGALVCAVSGACPPLLFTSAPAMGSSLFGGSRRTEAAPLVAPSGCCLCPPLG